MALSIIDRFLSSEKMSSTYQDSRFLHLLGITAIFIASKLEEIIPLHTDDLLLKAGHNKFSSHELHSLEIAII